MEFQGSEFSGIRYFSGKQGEITPLIGVKGTLVTHLFSATYRGYNSIYN